MASFTEQATLKVIDQSTAQINKINAALKKLFATARSLKSASINIKVSATGIEKTLAGLRKLNAEARKGTVVKQLTAAAAAPKQITKNLKPTIQTTKQLGTATKQLGTTGTTAAKQYTTALARVSQAQQQHNQHVIAAAAHQKQLQQQQQRTASGVPRIPPPRPPAQPWGPIRPPAAAGGGMPPAAGGGPPGGRGTRYGGGGYGRTPGGAFLGGFGGGIGIGLGRLNESFGLVALAGYAAAKALRSVAEAAMARDRAQLAVDTQTSAAQRKVFEQLDAEAKARGEYKGALRYKQDQFNLARASFLGDVGVDEGTKPTSAEGERQRAERADVLARTLYRDVVPGMFARNPQLSQQESQEELKKFVQTLGITTQKMFERDAQGKLQISEDAKRVMEGIRLAQIGAPDLTMGQIKTAAASIKSLGYTATPQQIAEILFNVSSKGQRAANEAYQMYKTGLGTTDVGKLNTAIEDLGLFIPGTAKRKPGKRIPGTKQREPGKVIAGTGVPVEYVDEEGQPVRLGERPSEWWRQAMKSPEVLKKAREMLIKQAETAPLQPGETRAGKIQAAKDKYKEGDALAVTDYINRAFSGARGTALQGILDSILGGDIAKSGLAQAGVAPKPEEINRRMEESWAVQASNLGTAVSDAAAKLGELGASAIGLAGILKGMTSFVDQNPLASGAIAIGIGAAVGAAVIVPFGMLTLAASRLIAAAGVLAGTGGGLPGMPGGGPAGGAGKWGKILTIGGRLMRITGGVAVALTAAEVAHYLATRTEEQAKDDEEKAQAAKDIAQKQASAARIEQEQKVQEDTPQSAKQQAYMAQQAQKLAGIKAEIARLQAVLDRPPPEAKPAEAAPETAPVTQSAINAAVTAAVNEYLKTAPKPQDKAAADAALTTAITNAVADAVKKTTPPPPPAPTDPVKVEPAKPPEVAAAPITKAVVDGVKAAPPPPPPAAPVKVEPVKPPPTAAKAATTATVAAKPPEGSLAALIPQLAATANSINLAVSGLATAGTTFATVFSTGATAIGTAGQTAASTLQGAAPSIGAAIGNAAANAIKAATANISVNVNAPSQAAPTSSSKAQN